MPTPFNFAEQETQAFNRRLDKVIRTFQRDLRNILSKFGTQSGKLIYDETNITYAAAMYNELIRAINDAGYGDVVKALQDSDTELIELTRKTIFVPNTFTQTSADVLNALRGAEATQFAAISEAAMSRVRDVVMRNVLTGSPIEPMLEYIQGQLETGFKRYAWTYANTTRRDVIQSVHKIAAEAVPSDERYWVYSGPEDDVTREACLELLAIGYFTDDEMQAAESSTADERAYNCRHVFQLISREAYEENVGDSKVERHTFDAEAAAERIRA